MKYSLFQCTILGKINTILCEVTKLIGVRYESYESLTDKLPFTLYVNLERVPNNCSKEQNWHDNLEIQLCTEGKGTVLLNGEKYNIKKNDIVVVNSNVIHYTATENSLTYSCLIVNARRDGAGRHRQAFS